MDIEALERRVFLTVSAPVTAVALDTGAELHVAAAAAPAAALTLANRQTLMKSWRGAGWQQLNDLLTQGKTAEFDQALLDYMVGRTNVHYYFDLLDVPGYVSYINSKLANRVPETMSRADALVAHLFPEQATSNTYTVQLPANINWLKQPSTTKNANFLHGLNRQSFWDDLSTAYRLTGQDKYINELVAELTSWSQQNPALKKPDDWRNTDPKWWLLDAAVRVQSWTDAYFQVLGTAGWTPEVNTLFLSRLFDHGDFLRRVTPLPITENQTQAHAEALLLVAQLFPEFKQSADWNTYGRNLLFTSFDQQFYADGGHIEESVTYQASVLNNLISRYALDQRNGVAWPAGEAQKLRNGIESFYQLLQPDGLTPAISDSYRKSQAGFFTEASIIFNEPRWPVSRPRISNVWFVGPAALDAVDAVHAPSPTVLHDRGSAFRMKQSGYYIMRSGDDRNARQVIFDAGPTGGRHGHFDLLSFELYGEGRVLIADPGLLRYDESKDRTWVLSTPAHNTISVDGKSHAALEGAGNKNIAVDRWEVADDHVQVTAHHFGYSSLTGAPAVGRSIWFDKDRTMLVVDWGQATASHKYTVSYTLPGTAVSAIESGSIHSTSGQGDVLVDPILFKGQTTAREARFTSSNPPPDEKDAAIRFTISQTGKTAIFATLVTTYTGAVPDVTAAFVSAPKMGQPVQIRLTTNGVSKIVVFNPPNLKKGKSAPKLAAQAPRPAATSVFADGRQIIPSMADIDEAGLLVTSRR